MMDTSTFHGSTERRMVQSPLCVCPRSAEASPKTAPATTKIHPITRLKFMAAPPVSGVLFLENVRVLKLDQFLQRQVLKTMLARLFDELRRNPLHFCSD